MTTVRLAPDGSVLDHAETRLPRHFRLAPPAVRRLAKLTGTTLPWPDVDEPVTNDLGLEDAGLVDPLGEVLPEARAAVTRLQAAEVLVDLDLAVRRASAPAGFARLPSWQRLHSWQPVRPSTRYGAGVVVIIAIHTLVRHRLPRGPPRHCGPTRGLSGALGRSDPTWAS